MPLYIELNRLIILTNWEYVLHNTGSSCLEEGRREAHEGRGGEFGGHYRNFQAIRNLG